MYVKTSNAYRRPFYVPIHPPIIAPNIPPSGNKAVQVAIRTSLKSPHPRRSDIAFCVGLKAAISYPQDQAEIEITIPNLYISQVLYLTSFFTSVYFRK